MFEFLTQTHSDTDAIAILKHDHDKVKKLFEEFEKTDDRRLKLKICQQTLMELKIHASIEEDLFYPALREGKKVELDILNEADEEHHVAKVLVAELSQMNGTEDHFDAKFHVLAENIRHHIKEEEGDMFPQARKSDVDFDLLGRKLLAEKQMLKKNGVPASAEDKMVSSYGKEDDSPAINARTKKSPLSASGKSSKAPSKSSKPAPKIVAKKAAPKTASKPVAKAPAKKPAAKASSKVTKLQPKKAVPKKAASASKAKAVAPKKKTGARR